MSMASLTLETAAFPTLDDAQIVHEYLKEM